jgi:hypothetical protein
MKGLPAVFKATIHRAGYLQNLASLSLLGQHLIALQKFIEHDTCLYKLERKA